MLCTTSIPDYSAGNILCFYGTNISKLCLLTEKVWVQKGDNSSRGSIQNFVLYQTMDQEYRFFSDFDSGNLEKVDKVSSDYCRGESEEFLLWLAPDCSGTEFQGGRTGTWFFFGMILI